MNEIAIRVDNLSKLYRIGATIERHDTLRDQIAASFTALCHRNGKKLPREPVDDTFWALKDVSFEVKQGEVVGIIGRNGAGKSTLLKIVSRITAPTSGRIDIHGRVRSLLEVGTGFHPELTGRENIYLNGAILGMKRAEIERKFDEIVAFSEVEKFIDMPVKRYSSGMYVRLAFAVAAHLEPEVLIVDEVLAVGDTAFQNKCLRKMGDIAHQGRTILFVSHNTAAVEHLCDKGIVLELGKQKFIGTAHEAVNYYLSSVSKKLGLDNSHIVDLSDYANRPLCDPALKRLEFYTDGDKPLNGSLKMGAALKAHLHFCLPFVTANFDATIEFDNLLGQRIFAASSYFEPGVPSGEYVGDHTLICEIPSLTLLPGEYKINVAIAFGGSREDCVIDCARITVVESNYYGTGRVPKIGLFALPQRWCLE